MRKLVSMFGAASLAIAFNAAAQDPTPAPAGDAAKPAEAPAEQKSGGKAVESGEGVTEKVKGETASAASAAGMKGVGTSSYGTAGCGLGSMLFEPSSGFTQIFAATSNSLFGTQTFGISSGTSNCEAPKKGPEGARAFVETNRVALAKDIARGRGETIASLSELAGCQNSRAVGRKLQRSFKSIFPNAKVTDQEVSASVVDVLKSEEALSCSKLGA